jgi:hypothetical protein
MNYNIYDLCIWALIFSCISGLSTYSRVNPWSLIAWYTKLSISSFSDSPFPTKSHSTPTSLHETDKTPDYKAK